jgi:amidase
VWNITDQSSAVFPVTRVTEADVAPTDLGEFRNAEEKAVWDSYDPKVVLGAPVGLQLVTRRLEEEKALALAGVAAKALAK